MFLDDGVLKPLAGFESRGFAGRDMDLLACPRLNPLPGTPFLHLENPKARELNLIALGQM